MEELLNYLTTLTQFSEKDLAVLQQHSSLTSQWADEAVKLFYDTLFGYEPTAKVFRENERPAREKTLRDWYLQVVSGQLPADWWRRQWLIGLVHIPRKIINPFMFGAMSLLQQFFLEKCLQTMPPEEAKTVFLAFKRVTDITAGLISEGYFDNYIDAMESSAGFRRSLIERMMEVELNKKLQEMRSKMGK